MIKFNSRIKKLERKRRLARAWKEANSDISTEYEDLGWALLLEGSTEWLFIGKEDPPADFKVGVPIVVTIAAA